MQDRPDAAVSGRAVLLGDRHAVGAADTYADARAAAVRACKLGGGRGLTAVSGALVADAVVQLLDHGPKVLVSDLTVSIASQLPGAVVVPCLRWCRVVAEQVGGAGRSAARLSPSQVLRRSGERRRTVGG